MNDILHEFLLETHENLVQLDLDLVGLEKSPEDAELLARGGLYARYWNRQSGGFIGTEEAAE